jgi:transcriptional regulator of acetoin/glycerol metabolism
MEHGDHCCPAPGAGAAAAEAAGCHGSHHNATPNGNDLKPGQTIALESLFTGMTVTRAAKAAGVDRTTVHRWLREDWAFQAAYNSAQRDLRREMETRLPHLAEAALETVHAAVNQGDVRAALAVLKGLGALPGSVTRIGAEDPAELSEEHEAAVQQNQTRRTLRRLTSL